MAVITVDSSVPNAEVVAENEIGILQETGVLVSASGQESSLANALRKLTEDLEELKTGSAEGRRPPAHEGSGNPSSLNSVSKAVEKSSHVDGPSGTGPLARYHRGVAVRMMNDYITDLIKLNDGEVHTNADAESLKSYRNVQTKIKEYQTALKAVQEADQREPNGQLTWKEKGYLKRMLKDYIRAFPEEVLDCGLESQFKEVNDKIESMGNRTAVLPFVYSAENFLVLISWLPAALRGCEAQIEEFSRLCPQVEVFRSQCSNLVETLSSKAREELLQYREVLVQLEKFNIDGLEFTTQECISNAVLFCIKSLSEVERMFQDVEYLLSMCCDKKWWRTTLKLADVSTSTNILRLSPFSSLHSKCEWSFDIAGLSFHALRKLVNSDETLVVPGDVDFKWSEENRRLEVKIQGTFTKSQACMPESLVGLLEVYKNLEARDNDVVIQKLDEVSYKYELAKFQYKKLTGPKLQARYLPASFRIHSSSLKSSFMEYIGAGASGMVAKYEWLGELVAVKLIRYHGLRRKTFEQEAGILGMVQHPNVVRLIGSAYLEKEETGMLVMELMEHDLRTVIEKRCPKPGPGVTPFTLDVAIDIILQIAEGMLYLQEHNILHRDLKAKNILVNQRRPICRALDLELKSIQETTPWLHTEEFYTVKLADFGLAKCRGLQSPWVATRMVGTTLWRAREVFNVPDTEVATEYNWRADVYSFGMTCYEIITGKIPFHDQVGLVSDLYQRIAVQGERPSLKDEDVEITPSLRKLIQQCWATNPNDRPMFADICKALWLCKTTAMIQPIYKLDCSNPASRSPSIFSVCFLVCFLAFLLFLLVCLYSL